MKKAQALRAIETAAEHVLAQDPDPGVKVRLLRDVLGRDADDPELNAATAALDTNTWVQLLMNEQDENGNFPRLHPNLRHFGFIEAAEIGQAVGLTREHPVFARLCQFADGVLAEGVEACRPQLEVCPFSRGAGAAYLELCLAWVLADLDPASPQIRPVYEKWRAVTQEGFSSGEFDEEAACNEYCRQFEPKKRPRGDCGVVGAACLLAWDPAGLSTDAERAYFTQVTRQICDFGLESFTHPSERDPESKDRAARQQTGRAAGTIRWLTRLRGLPSWRGLMEDAVPHLWKSQGDDGLWDYGSKAMSSGFDMRVMISGWWGKAEPRRHDWSTWVLLLLSQYYR